MLTFSGYDGTLEAQPESAITMIRALNGLTSAILFIGVAIMFMFYKIDNLMPEINAAKEAMMKKASEAATSE